MGNSAPATHQSDLNRSPLCLTHKPSVPFHAIVIGQLGHLLPQKMNSNEFSCLQSNKSIDFTYAIFTKSDDPASRQIWIMIVDYDLDYERHGVSSALRNGKRGLCSINKHKPHPKTNPAVRCVKHHRTQYSPQNLLNQPDVIEIHRPGTIDARDVSGADTNRD